jgi:tetratricopeptide (TPR) repeat protein
MAELFSRSGVLKLSEPQEKARRLMFQAWREDNPDKRVELAREALELTPNCADAYVLFAEDEAQSLEEAYAYYKQGVSAGEQFLGMEFFERHRGDFWALPETRPYMRARQGLAYCLEEMGMGEEALDHYIDMLQLNPPDNQGIRYAALALMLKLKKHEQACSLLDDYAEEDSATWLYSRALTAFREGGDSKTAQAALQAAIAQNNHVPFYLSGQKPVPADIPSYMGYGDESEAIHYTLDHLQNWWGTKGAIDWLKQNS